MILYPNILDTSFTSSQGRDFWTSVLERVCIGQAPFGTRILGQHLIYKNESLYLPDTNGDMVRAFFEKYVGLQLQFVHFKSWRNIKKKVVKDNILQEFVNNYSNQYKLSYAQCNYLLALIQLFITLKKIIPDNILLETGVCPSNPSPHTFIKDIKGLSYNVETNTFYLDHEGLCHGNEMDCGDEDEEDELIAIATEE
jgi:hypothetical protein